MYLIIENGYTYVYRSLKHTIQVAELSHLKKISFADFVLMKIDRNSKSCKVLKDRSGTLRENLPSYNQALRMINFLLEDREND